MDVVASLVLGFVGLFYLVRSHTLESRLDDAESYGDAARLRADENWRMYEKAARERDLARERDRDNHAAWRKASDERDALAQKLADGIRVLSGEGES